MQQITMISKSVSKTISSYNHKDMTLNLSSERLRNWFYNVTLTAWKNLKENRERENNETTQNKRRKLETKFI